MAVKLLRILGLCTPWRRIAHDGNVDRVRSILSQVMRGSFAQLKLGRWMARQCLQLLAAQLCAGDAAFGKQCDCDADIPSRLNVPARYLSPPCPPAACGPDPRSRRMDGGDAVVQSSGAQTVGIQCIGRLSAVALAPQCLPHQRPAPRPPIFVLLLISDVCCLPLCCKHGVSPLSLYINGPFIPRQSRQRSIDLHEVFRDSQQLRASQLALSLLWRRCANSNAVRTREQG